MVQIPGARYAPVSASARVKQQVTPLLSDILGRHHARTRDSWTGLSRGARKGLALERRYCHDLVVLAVRGYVMDSKLYLPERLALGLERPAIVIAIMHETSN